jgi:ADP-ribosylglycohydrolase
MGDAVGLAREGLSARRAACIFGPPDGHRLLFGGHGIGSDDTEHAFHTARALRAEPADADRFARRLAWSLRAWFLCVPAGIGFATARACLLMLAGVPPHRSGVHSAGNGPAMRSPLIGAFHAGDRELLRAFVRASTRMTHTHPDAEAGALLAALAAATPGDAEAFFAEAARESLPTAWPPLLESLRASLASGEETAAYAASLGLAKGVSGYILHTVPVALHAALGASRVDDAIRTVVALGGDADTTGAIAGAIAGARLGPATIPAEWLDRWVDWPITIAALRTQAAALAEPSGPPTRFAWWLVPPRNLAFLAIVLAHGFRRALPPW